MSRINTNVNSLIATRVLTNNQKQQSSTLEKLSTGLAINRGSDNPAGLIASENLRGQKAAIEAGITNAQRADQIVSIADGGLNEVNDQLVQLQSLVSQSSNTSGLSAEEKDANQSQIDTILQTIDRISSTTNFQGSKLLNGNYDFQVNSVNSNVSDYKINAAKIPQGSSVAVTTVVSTSAQHAGVFLSAGGTSLDLTSASSTFAFNLGGAKGARSFSFSSGTSLSSIETTINTYKSITGVSAHTSGNGIVLKSTDYGSDQFVSFKTTSGGGQTGGVYQLNATNENASQTSGGVAYTSTAEVRDSGQDVGGLINGIAIRGKGLVANANSDALDISLTLSASGATTVASTSSLTITGGGAKFNLGQAVDLNSQVRLGISDTSSKSLGDTTNGRLSTLASGGANSVTGNLETAQKIVNTAISQVASLRGKLGSFQKNTVNATVNSLNVALENTSAVESAIRDTDFATETAKLTRSQILVSAASTVLQTANSQPQQVLSLLR
jgi:flagellin